VNAPLSNLQQTPDAEPFQMPALPTRTALIQIVEDDSALAAILVTGLESRGYQAIATPSAAAALEQAFRQRPDLVLCDINMPRRSGHQLLRDFRADPALATCPIVFMTGNPRYAQPRVGMDLGADDFLLKPFTLDTLISCVAARLERASQQRRVEETLLRELRASLGETLPHEIFTPLGGIIGFAQLLEEEMREKQQEQTRAVAQQILRSGKRLHRTLRNYLDTLELDSVEVAPAREKLSATSVGQWIARGARAAAVRRERTADLILELAPAPLFAMPTDLNVLVDELADNAFQYSARGTPVRIVVAVEGERLRLTFIDHGRGMTFHQVREIGAFHQFERRKFEQQGLGLGLTVVRRALQRLGGELRFSSAAGHGVVAQVDLPLAGERDTRDEGVA